MPPVRPFFVLFLAIALSGVAGTASASRPVVEFIRPTSGPVGTVVDVVGRGLAGTTRVRVGGAEVTVLEVMPSRLRVRVPEGVDTGELSVDTPAGTISGPQFRVTARSPAPNIDRFEPKSGPPGSHVILRGTNFSPRLSGNVVTLGGQRVVVHAVTPIALDVIVPDMKEGGVFHVRVPNAGEAVSTERFTVGGATTITAIEPPRAAPATDIKVVGSGFAPKAADNRVYLNNVQLQVLSASPTQLVVRRPERIATGHVLVDVVGAGRASSPEECVPQRAPTIVGFAPTAGRPGDLVTVRGTNFGSDVVAVQAMLGEAQLRVREVHRTRMVLEVPAGAGTERLSIRVNGVGPAWSDTPYSVLKGLAIASFTPQAGPAGSTVTIRGQGFDPTPARNRVTVGGRPAEVIGGADGRIEFRVPPGGSGPVEVRLPNGSAARARDPFVVTQPPDVGSALPVEGTVGTDIVVRGRGFGSNPALVQVFLGKHPLEVRSVRDDQVVARITPGATTDKLRVEVRLQGGSELAQPIRVLDSLAVTAVEPASAPIGGVVTVRGSGFGAPGTLVEFGGVAGTPSAISTDRLRVAVPQGARSGILVVRLPDGRNSPGPQPFTVAASR